MHRITLPMDAFSKNFYMIRHGQTVANADGYAAGHLDTPLTIKGREQATQAAKALEQFTQPPQYIVHSPLIRAHDTAKLLNHSLNLPMFSESQLMEQDFGDWQQQDWTILHPLIEDGNHPPNGETYPQFYARAIAGISKALTLAQGTALIVTHGGVFDGLWQQFDLPKIDVKNTEFYFFNVENK